MIEEKQQKCPLCGYEFIPGEEQCKSACQMQGKCGGCSQISCPKCGYKMAGESKIVNWVKNIFMKNS
jgi:hypothetical protein